MNVTTLPKQSDNFPNNNGSNEQTDIKTVDEEMEMEMEMEMVVDLKTKVDEVASSVSIELQQQQEQEKKQEQEQKQQQQQEQQQQQQEQHHHLETPTTTNLEKMENEMVDNVVVEDENATSQKDFMEEEFNWKEVVSSSSCQTKYKATTEFLPTFNSTVSNNFTKGNLFSPDGMCILTNSEDNTLRLFESFDSPKMTSWMSVLQAKEGGTVYDFQWYPLMTSDDAMTCAFLTTSQAHPIHLWDAYNGQLRASYRAYNHLDEIHPAYSVAFSLDGTRILAGHNRSISIFDTSSPGKMISCRTLSKTRKSRTGQRGIISTLAFNMDLSEFYAAGSYEGTTYLYDDKSGETVLALDGHPNGVTQVKLRSSLLVTGGRKDSSILCWDIRNTSTVLHRFERKVDNNQKIGFDLSPCGQYLLTGSQDGYALMYEILTGALVSSLKVSKDAVNGASFHPFSKMLAFSMGQRHFELPGDMEDPMDQIHLQDCRDNSLELWKWEKNDINAFS